MYRKFLKTWALLLLSMILAAPVFGQDMKTIHVVMQTFPGFTNKDGTGLYFEMIREVYEPVGVKMKYEIFPWERCKVMREKKLTDALLGAGRVKGRYPMPKYPMSVSYDTVVFRKDRIKEWKGPESLRGKRVLWVRGSDYNKYPELANVKMEWDEINSIQEAWKLLEIGRYDFYIEMLVDIKSYVKDNNIDTSPYQMETISGNEVTLWFADTEKSKELIDIYDRRIIELFKSGWLKKLFEKWDVKYPEEAWEK